MVGEIRLYFEGDKALRPGFHEFLGELIDRARGVRCRFRLIATKGTPVQDYKIALDKHRDAWNILLLDSDGPDAGRLSTEFCRTHSLDIELASSVFWMVEVMESWFLADVRSLRLYYGQGFRDGALPGNANVEQVPKSRLLEALKTATRDSARGSYHKTKHAPALLGRLDPGLVREAAPNCLRLFHAVEARLPQRPSSGA